MSERRYVVVEMVHGAYYNCEDVSEVRGSFDSRAAAQAFVAKQPKCEAVSRYYVAPVLDMTEQADESDKPEHEWT